MRFSVSLPAFVLTILAVIWLHSINEDVTALHFLREHLRDDGFVIVSLYLVGLVLGALLHTVPAAVAGAPVRQGWRAVAVLLGYGVLVAAAAFAVAAVSPDRSVGHHRHDPASLYPTWLVCVLLPAAAVACAGGLFVRPRGRAAQGAGKVDGRLRRALPDTIVASLLLGWVIGACVLFLLLVVVVFRLLTG